MVPNGCKRKISDRTANEPAFLNTSAELSPLPPSNPPTTGTGYRHQNPRTTAFKKLKKKKKKTQYNADPTAPQTLNPTTTHPLRITARLLTPTAKSHTRCLTPFRQ